jgi:hypothetical protein
MTAYRMDGFEHEHQSIGRMLESLHAVVRVGSSGPLAHDAAGAFEESLRQHFRGEEAIAARRGDAEGQTILSREHARLLAAFGGIQTSIGMGRNRRQTERLLEDFANDMARHDAEIDAPLLGRLDWTSPEFDESPAWGRPT